MTPPTAVMADTEEALRAWSGRVLLRPWDPPPVPVADSHVVRNFLRHHGIHACINHLLGKHAPQQAATLAPPDWHRFVAVEMAMAHEFVRVLNELNERLPEPPLVYKGQALAYSLYTHPWLRPRGDIDALVDRNHFDAVVDLLELCGYKRETAIDGELVLKQVTLARHQHGTYHAWDLHWSISNRPVFADFLTYTDLFESGERIAVGDASFVAPNRVHGLLLACLHLVGHHASDIRMIWLYDIHLLADALSDSQVEDFLDAAGSRTEVRAACHGALAATQRYMPTPRTEALARSLDPGPGSRVYLEERRMSRLWADARAVGRGRRLQWLRQHLFPSRSYMMRRFGIRRGWEVPLWYVLRIWRAIPKLFRKR